MDQRRDDSEGAAGPGSVAYAGAGLGPRDEGGNHWNHRGIDLVRRGKLDQAIEAFRRAVLTSPSPADALNNLGAALKKRRRLEEAIVAYRESLRLRPDSAATHNNLGHALRLLGRHEEAEAAYREAARLDPEHLEAQTNIGNALKEQGCFREAIDQYERVLARHPDDVGALLDRAFTLLLLGNLERGWADHERRWDSRELKRRDFNQPAWDGSRRPDETVLLHAEQGLGDTIQFVRYASLVRPRCARVVVECQPSLVSIVRTCPGVDEVVPAGDSLPRFDRHAPLMSLPKLLGTTSETIPNAVPYLRPVPARAGFWRSELAALEGHRIGIAWQGNPVQARDHSRSAPLRRFAPLARVEGVRLISLQRGPGVGQLRDVDFPVLDVGSRLEVYSGDFAETAAVIAALDLVITVDSAVAHLAGSLDVPTWVALAYVPDWRWQLDREDSPWYPTMRLFRQRRRGDWAEVFERMAIALAARLRDRDSHQGEPSAIQGG
jgi:Flp pilus assembly protein TadD